MSAEVCITVFVIALILAVLSTVVGILLAPREHAADVMQQVIGDLPHTHDRD
jgi:hypothetical protein